MIHLYKHWKRTTKEKINIWIELIKSWQFDWILANKASIRQQLVSMLQSQIAFNNTHTVCTHLICSSWAKTHCVDWKTKHAVTEDVFESFTLSEHCCCLKNISEILKPPSFPTTSLPVLNWLVYFSWYAFKNVLFTFIVLLLIIIFTCRVSSLYEFQWSLFSCWCVNCSVVVL